ncbi:MAG: hypothetical protein IPP47_00405 [Bryobacterales bacterium]|nr:hypothetical protein [Bryobacterales bacterium]
MPEVQKPSFDPGLTQTFTGRISRTINSDGSFSVRRVGGRLKDAGYFLYFMNLSWPSFLVQVPLIYIGVITVFAGCIWSPVSSTCKAPPPPHSSRPSHPPSSSACRPSLPWATDISRRPAC